MISPEIINLAIVGVTLFVLLFYLIRFVFRYKHEYESNPLCTSAVILCLLVVFMTSFILPIDIFLVSYVKLPDGNTKDWATKEVLASIDEAVFATYYTLYGICIFLIFVVIPFLHFFNEEMESNSQDRLHNAIKYTFGFTMLAVLFITVGFAIPISNPDSSTIIDKVIHIVETTKFQQALNFVLSVITLAGIVNVSFYTASGLFCWPIGLLFGTSSVSNSLSTLNDREVALRVRVNALQQKARATTLTPREREQLTETENELRELEREENVLSGYTSSWSYKLRKAIRPMQVIAGTIFGLLSLFLLVTLIMVSVDRVLHGEGPKLGYLLAEPTIFNPLEYVSEQIENLVLIGQLPLLMITCFLVVATISGMRNLGLWFLFARLHRVKIGRTGPQALLYFCVSIMLTVLAFNMFLYSLIPQYTTFGDQHYRNSSSKDELMLCSLKNYDSNCILTRSSILSMRMMSQVWIFGAVFYWWNWVFVVVASISLIACLIRGKRTATHGMIIDTDDFEE